MHQYFIYMLQKLKEYACTQFLGTEASNVWFNSNILHSSNNFHLYSLQILFVHIENISKLFKNIIQQMPDYLLKRNHLSSRVSCKARYRSSVLGVTIDPFCMCTAGVTFTLDEVMCDTCLCGVFAVAKWLGDDVIKNCSFRNAAFSSSKCFLWNHMQNVLIWLLPSTFSNTYGTNKMPVFAMQQVAECFCIIIILY